jgi:hypothetical protein
LALLVDTGVDIAEAITVICDQIPSGPVRQAWLNIGEDINAARALSYALNQQRNVLGADYVVSISAGEASGKLAEPVTFSRIDIGNVISVIGVSGEPVSAYSKKVRSLIPNKSVVCVGCMDQVIGYLPTQEVQDQGGYEGGDFCRYFSLDALKPNIERTVMKAFSELIKS